MNFETLRIHFKIIPFNYKVNFFNENLSEIVFKNLGSILYLHV